MRLDSDIALVVIVMATNVWVLCLGIQQLINMRRGQEARTESRTLVGIRD